MTRRLVCAGLALGLLAVGLALVVLGLYGLAAGLGRISPESRTGAWIGFGLYYRVVLVKGLAPQWAACALLLGLGSWVWGDRRPRGALPLAAAVAHAPAAWLLPRPLGETLPPLAMRHPLEQLGTAALATAAVVLAWWAAERLTDLRPPAARRAERAAAEAA